MNRFKLLRLTFPFIMMTIPFAYLAYLWTDLPEKIPTHFNAYGLADKFGKKLEIFVPIIIFAAVAIGVYFLLMNLHKIDPKRKYTENTLSGMNKLAVTVVLLLTFISVIILNSTIKGKITTMPLMFCGISLFLAFIGNLMHSVKRNYFVGIRVPWTLENEDNWRQTHQLASKIFFAGGIGLGVLSLLLNQKILTIVFLSGVIIMVIIPVVYSYLLYRKSVK